MEDNKPPLSTASFGFDVESSKSKNVNSIFLPDVKPCKVDLKSEPETEYSSTSSSMIVRINRNLLKQGAQATRSPGVSAVTVTIQKSILQVKTKGRKTGAEDEANKKGGTGKGRSNRKRELELSEVGLDLKKVSKIFLMYMYNSVYVLSDHRLKRYTFIIIFLYNVHVGAARAFKRAK